MNDDAEFIAFTLPFTALSNIHTFAFTTCAERGVAFTFIYYFYLFIINNMFLAVCSIEFITSELMVPSKYCKSDQAV